MSTIQATLTGAQAIERALRIIANNGQNAPVTFVEAASFGEQPKFKRDACATNECVTCPYARERGSC